MDLMSSTSTITADRADRFFNLSKDQYLPEPPCPLDCPECAYSFPGFNIEEHLEWARISYHMKKPKLVFDGRDVLDVVEMEKLGIRVEALGKAERGLTLF